MAVKKVTVVPVITLEGRDKKTGDRFVYLSGKPVELLASIADGLIKDGLAQIASDLLKASPEAEKATVDRLVAVIEGLADEDFLADGRPSVEAMELATGLEVSGKQRDIAWEKYQEAVNSGS
ncbi:hypothetical protein [Thalassospira marina]|uniref:Uncharacterized protein n=1 Tax=Thalassospira marina TaxID=2048283 RepID=A0A2N3KJX7_9PROT|nr:hypothetical protein [Thalassospira marina]PKR50773.1 hypothetical protein COO20_20260 [Thalassospira marina]